MKENFRQRQLESFHANDVVVNVAQVTRWIFDQVPSFFGLVTSEYRMTYGTLNWKNNMQE